MWRSSLKLILSQHFYPWDMSTLTVSSCKIQKRPDDMTDIWSQRVSSVHCNETFIWWHWELYVLIFLPCKLCCQILLCEINFKQNRIQFKQGELYFQSSEIFKSAFVLCSKCHCLKYMENIFELALREMCVCVCCGLCEIHLTYCNWA